jgi:hypothetical protein
MGGDSKMKRNDEEFYIQSEAVKHLRFIYPKLEHLLIAIPNGEERPKKRYFDKKLGKYVWYCPAGKRAKALGLVKGAWDLFLALTMGSPFIVDGKANFIPGLWMEVKTPEQYRNKNHGLTPEQLEFGEAVKSQGFETSIKCTTQGIIDTIRIYMEG